MNLKISGNAFSGDRGAAPGIVHGSDMFLYTRRNLESMLSHFPQAVPEIPVSNVDKAAEYYVDVLGFHFDWGNDEGGIGGISQVDELYDRWREAGAKILAKPEDKPWHLRDFRVADLDGNQLCVSYDFSRELARP